MYVSHNLLNIFFSQAILSGIFTDSFPSFSEYSPSDWTYGEAVLKKRLGDNFFIYGMCVFAIYIHLVNFKDNSPPATKSSLLLLRYNDLN
jgi:hypothetical protein